MADILTVALSWAIGFTIISEALGTVVLLIPKAVKRIKAVGHEEGLVEGRAEGLAEGIAEERQAQSLRLEEAYCRFGIETDGVRSLPDTQEVRDFLAGKPPTQP